MNHRSSTLIQKRKPNSMFVKKYNRNNPDAKQTQSDARLTTKAEQPTYETQIINHGSFMVCVTSGSGDVRGFMWNLEAET